MKKILLSSLGVAALAFATHAQTPVKKSTGLVHKITATWCGPCGSWGWNLANEIITATEGKALYISLFASSSDGSAGGGQTWKNLEFYNNTAATLAQQFTLIGYPDFGANAITHTAPNFNGSTINVAQVKTDVINAINTFSATDPLASPASNMSVSGNTVTVNSKVQFWSAADGEYYLAAYIVEDGAMNAQNGQTAPTGQTAHHGVLRASMSTSAWGDQIATGSIPVNQTYTKTFTFTVTDTKWDKAKFKIYNVIWKKEGGVYKFINASLGGGGSTAIENLIKAEELTVYPNPADDVLNIDLDAVKSTDVVMTVTNILGQQALSNTATSLKAGSNHQTINTSSLAPGVYFLNIKTEEGNIQKKFVKK